jgi:spore cortex protein
MEFPNNYRLKLTSIRHHKGERGFLVMAKKTSLLAVAVLATGVLTACNGDNDNNMLGNDNNDSRPIGYYSNDRDMELNNNNGGLDQGEGPLTEMMENDNNRNGQNNRLLINNDTNNRNNNNRNNTNNNNAKYAEGYDGKLAERIERQVEGINNVDEARVIVTDDRVLVGIDTNDRNDKNTENQVRNAVKKLTKKQVSIADDENAFDQMGDITDDLQNGKAFDEVQSDVNNIVNDLGDAVQRPFQNNR